MKFKLFRIQIKYSLREEQYQKWSDAIIIDGNIMKTVGQGPLPDRSAGGQKDDKVFVEWTDCEYSPVYAEESKGIVNTRARYTGTTGNHQYIYFKLSRIERIKLDMIQGKSPLSRADVVLWLLGIPFLAVGSWGTINQINSTKEKEILEQEVSRLRKESQQKDSLIRTLEMKIIKAHKLK